MFGNKQQNILKNSARLSHLISGCNKRFPQSLQFLSVELEIVVSEIFLHELNYDFKCNVYYNIGTKYFGTNLSDIRWNDN